MVNFITYKNNVWFSAVALKERKKSNTLKTHLFEIPSSF